VNPYLERLIDLGLVERRTPPDAASLARPRTSQYVLGDQYLRFYYAFVDPWRSSIQLGQGAAILDELWGDPFDEFVSRTFEEPANTCGASAAQGVPVDRRVLVVPRRHRCRRDGRRSWSPRLREVDALFVKPGDLDDLRAGVSVGRRGLAAAVPVRPVGPIVPPTSDAVLVSRAICTRPTSMIER
jgi:hypothetical protein